ncbi:peptidase of plants and bacteria-domain-containing protein [Stachybotrys elegans]|uniref:Peptidase of plants and bacteria-domain-containing protein n=1 Tax=Stachybotrys elegans TaxID=80388 RepID=A0A8K0WXZ6_9HYPO|nr:peptidase of plants and bacteria-domain-containing protein [Stachybotrys elegans]
MSPAVQLPTRPRPDANETTSSSSDGAAAAAGQAFAIPKLRLEMRDLLHKGSHVFLESIVASDCMTTAVRNLLRLLYHSPSCPTTTVPPTRSVTLILRDMGGVAYTTGSDLDNDHKEIHFSLSYIAGIGPQRATKEITGVLTHELVHCFQYNAFGSCPGGLIEGIADWVRLRCDLAPPHWTRDKNGSWDRGYQHTAYFLDYLEGRFGDGTVRRLNEKLRIQKYHEDTFWPELLGHSVDKLWTAYVDKLKDDEAGQDITTCKTGGS